MNLNVRAGKLFSLSWHNVGVTAQFTLDNIFNAFYSAPWDFQLSQQEETNNKKIRSHYKLFLMQTFSQQTNLASRAILRRLVLYLSWMRAVVAELALPSALPINDCVAKKDHPKPPMVSVCTAACDAVWLRALQKFHGCFQRRCQNEPCKSSEILPSRILNHLSDRSGSPSARVQRELYFEGLIPNKKTPFE